MNLNLPHKNKNTTITSGQDIIRLEADDLEFICELGEAKEIQLSISVNISLL